MKILNTQGRLHSLGWQLRPKPGTGPKYPASQKFKEVAYHRAMGMHYSDLWVNQGKQAKSPLLVKEEEALKEAINS